MATYKAMWKTYRKALRTGNEATTNIAERLAEIVVRNGDVPGCQDAVGEARFILNEIRRLR